MRYIVTAEKGLDTYEDVDNIDEAMQCAHALAPEITNGEGLLIVRKYHSDWITGAIVARVIFNVRTNMVETSRPVHKIVYEECDPDTLVAELS